jgi:hypothetical protein
MLLPFFGSIESTWKRNRNCGDVACIFIVDNPDCGSCKSDDYGLVFQAMDHR